MPAYEAIIIGGGLAGLSAAFRLAAKERKVLLLEAREHVGGRAASWDDQGMLVESGLHRYLGFYSELPRLMEDAGIDLKKALIWEDEIEIRVPDGPSAVYGMSLLSRPIETIEAALGKNELLSVAERKQLAIFFTSGLKDYALHPEGLDEYTVTEYAKRHKVSDRAIERILGPLTAGLFFLPPDRYSAFVLFGLIGQGARRFYKAGLAAFTGGMTDVMCEPIAEAIRARGGSVRTGAAVERIVVEGGRVNGVVVQGETLTADHVVLAASLAPAQKLIRTSGIQHPDLDSMLELASMPSVTIQMELDRPALEVDRATFAPATCLAAFSEQSRTTFRHLPGRLSIILTPPEKYLHRQPEEVLRDVFADAGKVGLDLEGRITQYRVIEEPDDFYSLTPGSEAMRPAQRIGVPGLVLAGDYTKQNFLATMEGAVISGKVAAEAVLDRSASQVGK